MNRPLSCVFVVVLALFTLLPRLSHAQPQPYTVNGPFGGSSSQLSIYSDGERQYAVCGTDDNVRLYSRPNTFMDWVSVVDVDAGQVGNDLPVYWTDPRDDNHVWVVEANASTALSQGLVWTGEFEELAIPETSTMLQVLPSPTNPERTYLVSLSSGGYYQLHAQNTWGGDLEIVRPIINGLIAIYGGAADTLYTTDLWSVNSGQSWMTYGGDLSGERMWVNPSGEDFALFRVRREGPPFYDHLLEHSVNRGFSWTEMFAADTLHTVSIDGNGNALVVTDNDLAWYSDNGGFNWQVLDEEFDEVVTGAAADGSFTNQALLGFASGVYRANGGWTNRQPQSDGLLGTTFSSLAAPGVFDAANNADTLLAAGTTGIYLTETWGDSWERNFDQPVVSLSFHETDPARAWAVGRDAIYQSFSAGNSWTQINYAPDDEISAVLASPTDDQRVFIRTEAGVERSINSGLNWVLVFTDDSGTLTHRLDRSSSDPDFLYTHTDHSYIWSANGGFEWDEYDLPDEFAAVRDVITSDPDWTAVLTDTTVYLSDDFQSDFYWNLRQDAFEGTFPDIDTRLTSLVSLRWTGPGLEVQFIAEDTRLYYVFVPLLTTSDGVRPGSAQPMSDELDEFRYYGDGVACFLGSWDGAAAFASTRGGVYTSPDAYVGVDEDGSRDDNAAQPSHFTLHPAYPNPFNPSTTVTLEMPLAGEVAVTVSNLLGQRVAVLHDGTLVPGQNVFTWNASGHAAGTYLVRASMHDGPTVTQKVVLVK